MRSERFNRLGSTVSEGHFIQRSTALYKSRLQNKGLHVDKERIYMRRALLVGVVSGLIWLVGIVWLIARLYK